MIKACGKSIIVSVIKEADEKKGLLIIPKEKEPFRGVVMATGSDVDKNIQLGDLLIIAPHSGFEVALPDGSTVTSILERDVMMVLQED